MTDALVFGGSGQIGVPVLARLRAQGWRVFAVSRQIQQSDDGVHWLHGDFANLPQLPSRVDAVFSLGPLDHFAQWFAASRIETPRVIAFGSTSLETKRDSRDEHERDLAKRLDAAEKSLFQSAASRNAHVTLLRPTLVYGAGRDHTLTRIAQLAQRTGFFVLPRGANGLRQPVHVEDLVDAALAVFDRHATFGCGYALPGGETLTYRDMIARTLATLSPPPKLWQIPSPMFALALSAAHALGKLQSLNSAAVARMREDLVFDMEPARRDFGYAPRKFAP